MPKNKLDDGAYNKKSYDFSNPSGKKYHAYFDDKENIAHFLYKTNYSFLDNNANETQVKTSIRIDLDLLKKYNPHLNFNHPIWHSFTKVKSYAEIAITEKNEKGSPTKGITLTPSKSKLYRTTKIGPLSILTNLQDHVLEGHLKTQTTLDPNDSFFSSEEYKNAPAVTNKQQKNTINKTLLKKTKLQNELNPNRSQNSSMNVSVSKYVDSMDGISTDLKKAKKNWLHLEAAFIDRNQQPDNLVAGTVGANGEMSSLESKLSYLASVYPEGYDVEISASTVDNTHLGQKIEYLIKTKDFTLPFSFNAQNPNQPHISLAHYMREFIEIMVALSKLSQAPEQESKKNNNPKIMKNLNSLFYSKQKDKLTSIEKPIKKTSKKKKTKAEKKGFRA